MENLIINQVPIAISDSLMVKFYCKFSDDFDPNFNTKEIETLLIKTKTEGDLRQVLVSKREHKYIHFTFTDPTTTDDTWQTVQLDLNQETYFKPIYLNDMIYHYFLDSTDLLIEKDFVGNLRLWEKIGEDDYAYQYHVFNVKLDRIKFEYYLTIGINSQKSQIYKKNVRELGIDTSLARKVLIGRTIRKSKKLEEAEVLDAKPIFNKDIAKGVQGQPQAQKPTFSFITHYDLIEKFYSEYLKTKELGENIKVLASGLRKLTENEIYHTSRENNKLEFGKGNFEFDAYRGFSNYGPYKLPKNIENIKFIFIFHETDKELANDMYKYLRYGHRHFPGLESFAGIKFSLDKDNSVIFKDKDNPIPEIQSKLKKETLNKEIFYVALYVSPFSEETASEDQLKIYYRVKEELLKLNITSQVIESEKLKSQNVHFYLPNIAIALVAKTGGIPWKLKRDVEKFLLLGFGDCPIPTDDGISHFIGNTICFTNEGEFRGLNSFDYTDNNLKDVLESAIKQHIEENGSPTKLIIHFFKDWGTREDNKLLSVFKKLNVEVPYVVLNINDNKARDYICFDMGYLSKIPLSGTLVEIKQKEEYLLFNNERYSSDMSSYKGKDVFPIKIKVSASKNIDLDDSQEINQLMDQVYQFSRLYWRSIKQKSLPVTTYYAKRLAERVSHFENKQLPNTDVAKNTLWFI